MPPTTENIPEKPPFDVYAMLLILSFVFTVGATLLLNDELDKNWGFWEPKEQVRPRALHITEINEAPDKYPDLINVRKIDLEEWKIAIENQTGKKADFPEKGFEWPAGYDPLAHPIVPGEDNLAKVPKEQIDALLKGREQAGETKAEAPAPAPAEKPAEKPAEEPKTN
ncbi:MAG TPA: hypothetical protein VEK08_08830 [Planctomycetota bacterium]|nr:hypothetical protein [Planctomycetota bacterium]